MNIAGLCHSLPPLPSLHPFAWKTHLEGSLSSHVVLTHPAGTAISLWALMDPSPLWECGVP